jgi:hypothetical protein
LYLFDSESQVGPDDLGNRYRRIEKDAMMNNKVTPAK